MLTVNKSLECIRKALVKRDESIAVAESVTSGNLQAAFSLAEEATYFYQGGMTAYNLGQKARHFDVDPIAAENCNCVSGQIAADMAVRASKIFTSDWGIGVTGYAAPVPEWDIDNVLFAYYAFAHKGECVCTGKIETSKAPMKKVQELYVKEILNAFATFIDACQPITTRVAQSTT
jgi:PncC family amidohydrolase